MAGLSWRGKRTLDFPRFAGYNDHDQEVRINSDVHQSGAPGRCSFRAALISSFDSQVSGSEEGRAVLTSTAKTPACTTPRTGDIQKNGGTPCAPPFSLFHRARRILSFRKRENGGCIAPAIADCQSPARTGDYKKGGTSCPIRYTSSPLAAPKTR